MGTRIWAATDPAPTMRATPIRRPISGDTAATTRLAAVTVMIRGMRRRRETKSPTGTRRARPAAYPIWEKLTISPAVAELVPKPLAMVSRTGWA